ncbi:stalk domain-containing protein [Paenibacillus sp. EC2-1]|uniref:stalk domain-containing protein n=1 Tax=Paenibacillus sp. EC2-1 TaxID=3388665 RepID=UPI003BEF2BE9
MRKFWTALLAGLLIIPLLFQSQAQAAVNFTILIDGVRLATSQAPVMIQGRVMLPMRAIFEALDAKVTWNQKAQTVTAVKDGTTIVLKINSKTATINRQSVNLDVPAKNLRGTTMVPVRFVSESLGEKVGWNSKTKTVSITTSGGVSVPDSLNPASYVTLRDVANYGDGRDLQVNFSKSSNESRASQYRIMVVKASKSGSFNLSSAQMVSNYNYAVIFPNGSDPSITLNSASRDVDGEYIRDNQSYVAYVLSVGKVNGDVALSSPSPALTLANTNAVDAATNVKGTDVNDYNDGRDLSVSFTRAKTENNISNYRVIAVKTKDISKFDLAAAKAVASQNYTTINKTSSSSTTLTTVLNSSSRDSSGEYIRNGIPYTLYVLSVSSNENSVASKLSTASSSITLATGSSTAPVITQVTDVNDYGDGRDLRVSFTKLSDESGIGSYRIFVVKSSDYQNFNLTRANNVSSYNYTQVNKTGSNIIQTLSSGARDVDGAAIRSGVYYRIFVMSVATGNNSGNNKLSSPSSDIILYNNNSYVGSISNLYVSDVSDYNDGRDLQVSFTRASDEYNISHYRAFVVKTSKANYFDLNDANSLSSYYYTQINKTGYNITQNLNSSSRDTDGDYIRNGTSYRVFILSQGNNNSSNNALSSYSSTITLSNNRYVTAVTNVAASDVSDYGDGRDLRVSFTKASDEYNIGSYRAFVVKDSKASNFNLNTATNNSYYTQIYKTGSNISQILGSGSKDTDGEFIREGISYRVFIMSVGSGNYSNSNALSYYSSAITLGKTLTLNPATAVEAKDISDNNNGSDLQVKFDSSSDYNNISEYRILVVKKDKASGFDLTAANAVRNHYTSEISRSGTITKALAPNAKDTDGDDIKDSTTYRVFVLAIGKGNLAGKSAISIASADITLTANTKVDAVTNVTAEDNGDNGDGRDLFVSFNKAANEDKILQYQVYVVKESASEGFTPGNSGFTTVNKTGSNIRTSLQSSTTDSNGGAIVNNQPYKVFVVSVSKDGNASNNTLSAPSAVITLEGPEISAPTIVKTTANDYGFEVTFSPGPNSKNVEVYKVMLVPDSSPTDNLENATTFMTVAPNSNNFSALLEKDINNAPLSKDTTYKAYVLAVNKSSSAKHALSAPSGELKLPQPNEAAASNVTVEPVKDTNSLNVSFKIASKDSEITSYQVVFLPADSASSFNLKKATASKTLLKTTDINPSQSDNGGTGGTGAGTNADAIKKFSLEIPTKDGYGADIQAGKEYKAVVLSLVVEADKAAKTVAVSNPSKGLVLVAAKAKK